MDAMGAYERRSDLVFLDVREGWEWAAGRIDGAVHIPMGELPARVSELDTESSLLCVCRTGHRSHEVARWLTLQGFDARNLDGGIVDWAARGLPFDGEVV